MKVLQLTVHLFPNVGGVETHLNDLFTALRKREWKIFALAYQPLTTRVDWKLFENKKGLTIIRLPWLRGFFEKLVNYPILEFIYLVPGLFIISPFVIAMFRPQILHAHGLAAAVSAVFWGKLFKIRTVISLHSFYSFPKNGLYHDFVKSLLNNADYILSLSEKSKNEIKSLGLNSQKLGTFTYWIDLERFKKVDAAKQYAGWKDKFVVLFVGRLIKEKGLEILLRSVKSWNKSIQLVIIGAGPMEEEISRKAKLGQIQFLGKKTQEDLPFFYSATNCLIVPSTSEEGFGRVIIEALACGIPVIAAKRGAISEAMDETVGKLIDISEDNIKNTVEYFFKNRNELKKLSQNARQFAERRYAEGNANSIIKVYTA